jgi:hypothetical protein
MNYNFAQRVLAATNQSFWVVKKGTKQIVEGPFTTRKQAEDAQAKVPLGTPVAVTQGDYLGNKKLA